MKKLSWRCEEEEAEAFFQVASVVSRQVLHVFSGSITSMEYPDDFKRAKRLMVSPLILVKLSFGKRVPSQLSIQLIVLWYEANESIIFVSSANFVFSSKFTYAEYPANTKRTPEITI